MTKFDIDNATKDQVLEQIKARNLTVPTSGSGAKGNVLKKDLIEVLQKASITVVGGGGGEKTVQQRREKYTTAPRLSGGASGPSATEWRVYRQELQMWYDLWSSSWDEKYLLVAMLEGIDSSIKAGMYDRIPSGSLSFKRLVQELGDDFGREARVDRQAAITTYNACKRSQGEGWGPFLARYRHARQTAVNMGCLQSGPQDAYSLLTKAVVDETLYAELLRDLDGMLDPSSEEQHAHVLSRLENLREVKQIRGVQGVAQVAERALIAENAGDEKVKPKKPKKKEHDNHNTDSQVAGQLSQLMTLMTTFIGGKGKGGKDNGGGRDGGDQTVCNFFKKNQKCKFGDKCKFKHIKTGNTGPGDNSKNVKGEDWVCTSCSTSNWTKRSTCRKCDKTH